MEHPTISSTYREAGPVYQQVTIRLALVERRPSGVWRSIHPSFPCPSLPVVERKELSYQRERPKRSSSSILIDHFDRLRDALRKNWGKGE